MTYNKPHLVYAQQLALLKSRGVVVDDQSEAIKVLESVGYYNFTGYLYPYRLPNPSGQGRLDQVQPDTKFSDVYALLQFDRRLRSAMLDGILQVEIAIRARIAYTLGQHDPFGHLNQNSLDQVATSRTQTRRGVTKTTFDWWLEEFSRLQARAQTEPYVGHNLAKYGPPLPVWIACQFFDFGAVTRLLQFLPFPDRQMIAASAGLSRERTLRSWMTTMNYVRNICAHNARLWNRKLIQQVMLRPADLPAGLTNLAGARGDQLYPVIAITAYLMSTLTLNNEWAVRMTKVIQSFPDQPTRSIQEIGIPSDWQKRSIWQSAANQKPQGD